MTFGERSSRIIVSILYFIATTFVLGLVASLIKSDYGWKGWPYAFYRSSPIPFFEGTQGHYISGFDDPLLIKFVLFWLIVSAVLVFLIRHVRHFNNKFLRLSIYSIVLSAVALRVAFLPRWGMFPTAVNGYPLIYFAPGDMCPPLTDCNSFYLDKLIIDVLFWLIVCSVFVYLVSFIWNRYIKRPS